MLAPSETLSLGSSGASGCADREGKEKTTEEEEEKEEEEEEEPGEGKAVDDKEDFADSDAAFTSYLAPDGRWPVTFRVLKAHNEVGCRVWEAGLHLASVCSSGSGSGSGAKAKSESSSVNAAVRSLVAGRRVLELGAGVGVTGMLLASSSVLTRPAKLWLTDRGGAVLRGLRANAAYNAPGRRKALLARGSGLLGIGFDGAELGTESETHVSVRALDWDDPEYEACVPRGEVDTLLVRFLNLRPYVASLGSPLLPSFVISFLRSLSYFSATAPHILPLPSYSAVHSIAHLLALPTPACSGTVF